MLEKYICWDFDRTLGLFAPPGETSEESENEDEPLGSRFGMRETLVSLSGRGYRHLITTANPLEYPMKKLEMTDFEQYIERIFGMFELMKDGGRGKNYDIVRQYLEWTKEEAIARMLVVGDNDFEQDIPYNLPILFINQDYGYRYDAKVIDLILKRLEIEDKENLRDAFEKLNSEKRVDFEGISFRTKLQKNAGIDVPVTYDIYAECLKRPVVPLD